MSTITATIKSEGKTLPQEYDLLSIEVTKEVNRIPSAELVLIDGDAAKQQFALSDEAFFEPGKEIEIQLRYEGKGVNETIFKGLVLRHNLEASAVDTTLTVEISDKALAMTMERNSAVFEQQTDKEIISDLIRKSGLKAAKIADTKTKHEEIVQYYCSNWDFMLLRAEANKLVVSVEDGTITLHDLAINGAAKHRFEYGISEMYGFEMEADASHQYKSIDTVAWDIKTQQLTKKSEGKQFALAQGDLKGETIASKLGGRSAVLTNAVPLAPKETKAWADSVMARSRMSLLRGVVSVAGFANIQLMDPLELSGIGKRFNGKTVVTGIRHTVNQEGWQTHIQFGLSGCSFSRSPDILEAPAAGLLPAVQGLQIGIVDNFEEDKNTKEFRVRLTLPSIDAKKGKIWARLASPDAGKERGFFFRPEKGDEVVVGFFNDDPRQAVILGALFSSKNTPPKAWQKLDATNAFKGFVSKTGISLEINDQAKTLKLLTSEKQSILLDEKNKRIEIQDLNKNRITLDSKGIHLETSGKLSMEAKGDLELKGKNIKLQATANIAIKGKKVDVQ